jgi:hypothetical protein
MEKVWRQRKYHLDFMARGRLLVVVAPKRQAHLDLLLWNFDFGPHNDVRFLPWSRSNRLRSPDRGTNDLGSKISIVRHNLLRAAAVIRQSINRVARGWCSGFIGGFFPEWRENPIAMVGLSFGSGHQPSRS